MMVLPLLVRDAVRNLEDEMGLGEDDLLYVLRVDGWGRSVVRELAEAKVKAVILPHYVYLRVLDQQVLEPGIDQEAVIPDRYLWIGTKSRLQPLLRSAVKNRGCQNMNQLGPGSQHLRLLQSHRKIQGEPRKSTAVELLFSAFREYRMKRKKGIFGDG
jgi:hypothetical protein